MKWERPYQNTRKVIASNNCKMRNGYNKHCIWGAEGLNYCFKVSFDSQLHQFCPKESTKQRLTSVRRKRRRKKILVFSDEILNFVNEMSLVCLTCSVFQGNGQWEWFTMHNRSTQGLYDPCWSPHAGYANTPEGSSISLGCQLQPCSVPRNPPCIVEGIHFQAICI